MVKNLLVICLVLFGCHSTRHLYGYEPIPLDKEWQKSLDEDFDGYLTHFTEQDASRDGYYLVYDPRWDAVVPSAFLFFYGGNDSVSVCPFEGTCKTYEIRQDDFPVDALDFAQPLRPYSFSQDTTMRIYGFKKTKNEKKYYLLYKLDACESEQCSISTKIFNQFSSLVTTLYESNALNENR